MKDYLTNPLLNAEYFLLKGDYGAALFIAQLCQVKASQNGDLNLELSSLQLRGMVIHLIKSELEDVIQQHGRLHLSTDELKRYSPSYARYFELQNGFEKHIVEYAKRRLKSTDRGLSQNLDNHINFIYHRLIDKTFNEKNIPK